MERIRAEGSAIISGFYTEELRGAEGRVGERRYASSSSVILLLSPKRNYFLSSLRCSEFCGMAWCQYVPGFDVVTLSGDRGPLARVGNPKKVSESCALHGFISCIFEHFLTVK